MFVGFLCRMKKTFKKNEKKVDENQLLWYYISCPRGSGKQKDISNRIEKDKKANTTINWCKTKAVIINY